MPPSTHTRFVDHVVSRLTPDTRFLGLAAAGSWITNELDEFSDLDLVLVYDPARASVLDEKKAIADSFGPCLSSFTGEHVGVPQMLICLYDDPLLHVDLKFVSLDELRTRIENPVVLWERDGALTRVIEETKPTTPHFDLQWVEDRFWTWIHYGAQRLGRGELFEVLSTLAFLRDRALGPMEVARIARSPRGVRRIEAKLDADALADLRSTVAAYDAASCARALKSVAKTYVGLREDLDKGDLQRNRRAEMASLRYLHEISDRFLQS